jgi:anti-sigma factor RsiW
MKCSRVEKLLLIYLEDELSPQEKRLLEAHLRQCPDCQATLAYLRAIPSLLASIPEREISPSLQAKLYAIPALMPATAKKGGFSLDWLLRPSFQPVLAAASVFLFVLSFFLFHPDGRFLSRSINEQLHLGYSRLEKIVAKAESLPGYLPALRESLQNSLKSLSQSRPHESDKI